MGSENDSPHVSATKAPRQGRCFKAHLSLTLGVLASNLWLALSNWLTLGSLVLLGCTMSSREQDVAPDAWQSIRGLLAAGDLHKALSSMKQDDVGMGEAR